MKDAELEQAPSGLEVNRHSFFYEIKRRSGLSTNEENLVIVFLDKSSGEVINPVDKDSIGVHLKVIVS